MVNVCIGKKKVVQNCQSIEGGGEYYSAMCERMKMIFLEDSMELVRCRQGFYIKRGRNGPLPGLILNGT